MAEFPLLAVSTVSLFTPGRGGGILEIVGVVDVASAETQRRATGAEVGPVVVGVGDAEMTLVLVSVVLAVANQRSLPVVVEVGA